MNQQNQRQDSRQHDAEYYRRRQRQYEQYLYESTLTDEEREARRRGREEARRLRQRAKRAKKMRRMLPSVILSVVLLAAGIGSVFLVRALWKNVVRKEPETEQTDTHSPASSTDEEPEAPAVPEEEPEPVIAFHTTPATVNIPEKVIPPPETTEGGAADPGEAPDTPEDPLNSAYAILIDLDEGAILVQRNARKVIHPASMTKILTVLVAAEHITNYNTTATVTQATIDYCIENNCSIAGFTADEEVSIMDLFYGTILPSGADAAVTLAEYVAGSHEAFVKLMNEKAEELGISETAHFANCVGLFDEKNVCTVYDIAVILKAAMENPLCRQVLGLRIHDIPASELHPEGITLSNWFIRRIEDHMPEGVVIRGAKTGFISEAGSCAASLAQDGSGRSCLCVTAMAGSAWQCIFDHAALYEAYGFNALT